MARLVRRLSSSDPASADIPPTPGRLTTSDSEQTSNSDKENRTQTSTKQKTQQKRKIGTAPMSDHSNALASANKRRRAEVQPSAASTDKPFNGDERRVFDPDQSINEVRKSRRLYRELETKLNESRSEFMNADSKGLEEAVREADHIFKSVKQTSVAVIDSRLLVNIGDLANRKVKTLTLGDSSTGVDVDDFITKCIYFMKHGLAADGDDPVATQSMQHQMRRRRNPADEEEEEDSEEPMNWARLGRDACFLYNSRPNIPGFLLGPLSVQKKQRQQSQRKGRQTQADSTQASRPRALGAEDLEQQESANLTVICGEIARLLEKTISRGSQRVEEEYESFTSEPSEQDVRDLMARHGLTDNGCVPLFNFCVNPKSFGQTVENMFYVSFLIKEGKVGLDFDSHGLPTLGTAESKSVAERQETQRNQAVFTLDFDIWQELVDSFGIVKSIIPHRKDELWDDGTIDQAALNGEASGTGGSNDIDDDDDEE